MTRAFRGTAGLLLFALAMALGLELEGMAKTRASEHSLYLPSGRYLRWVSLGHRALLADLIYIWSIQYYSNEREDRWHFLEQTYDVITDLDPHFLVAYSIGALILSMEAGHPKKALDLLERGMKQNPGRYLLPWEAAFYARDLGQRGRMSEYLRIARDCPDAPDYVGRWYGFTLVETGQRDEALEFWIDAYNTARTDYERQVAERYVSTIRQEMLLERMRAVIDEFRAREGRWPRGLEELLRAGLLGQLPVDPAGRPLQYDPATGQIHAESTFLQSHRMFQ